MIGLAEGLMSGYGMASKAVAQQAEMEMAKERAAREAESHAQALQLGQLQIASAKGNLSDAENVRSAGNNLQSTLTNGTMTGQVQGLPAANDAFQGNIKGYGSGVPAVTALAGDYSREASRMADATGAVDPTYVAPAPGAGAGAPAPGDVTPDGFAPAATGLPVPGAAASAGPAAGMYSTANVGQRAATQRDIIKAQMGLAAASKDSNAVTELMKQSRQLDYKDAYGAAGAKFDQLTPEQQNDAHNRVTQGFGGPINMTVPDNNGVTHVVLGQPGDKNYKSVGLNPEETRTMFIAAELRKEFPMEAAELMEKGGEKLRAINKEYSANVLATATANSTMDKNAAEGAALTKTAEAHMIGARAQATHAGASADLAKENIQNIRDERANRVAAAGTLAEIQNLDPKSPTYEQDLRRKTIEYNAATIKLGGQVNPGRPPAGSAGNATLAAKLDTDNGWKLIEGKLREQNTPAKDINQQKIDHYASAGFAPAADIAAFKTGRDPSNGKKLTIDDVAKFNAQFPHTPLSPSDLPWLKSASSNPTPAATGLPAMRPGLDAHGSPTPAGATAAWLASQRPDVGIPDRVLSAPVWGR